jgi:hypothetical protein
VGFFLGYRFLNPSGLAYGSYETKTLLKVVFDKTAPVKLKISNNLKQNLNVPNSKQPKIHGKLIPTYGF